MEIRERVRRIGRWRIAAVAVVALLGAGAVVALAGGPDRGSGRGDEGAVAMDATGVDGPATTVAPFARGETAASDAAEDGAAPPDGVLVTSREPRVVRTAELRVEVARDSAGAAVRAATDVAADLGGFVTASRTVASEAGGTSGEVTVRVPVGRFDEARDRLAALGEVREELVGGEDVTAQLVDLDARIRSLQAEEEAYRTLLGRAEEIGDVLVVHEQLFAVRTQIEQLQAQQAGLADEADLATLRVTFVEPGAPFATTVPSEPGVLAQGLERAAGGTLAVVAGTLVVLGYAIPLAVLGALVWAIWVLVRRSRRPVAPPLAS